MRTNDLRKAVKAIIKPLMPTYGVKNIYFRRAKRNAIYPHIVITMPTTDLSDFFRKDYVVDIDIYTRDEDLALNIADDIEDVFNNLNAPEDSILPTFFVQTKIQVEDQDETITHEVVRLQCQLYDNK